MPIRGTRNPFPKAGGKPSGIFSTHGRQKQDGASGPHMGTYKYAHAGGGETAGKPVSGSGQSKRHQSVTKKHWK